MEKITVATKDGINVNVLTINDFYEVGSKKFLEIKDLSESEVHISIRGNQMYQVSNNEIISIIAKNTDVNDYVSTVSIFKADGDTEIIVCFTNHTKNIEIVNETYYNIYLSKKAQEEELQRIAKETKKLEEEAKRIEEINRKHKQAKFKKDSAFMYPFFEDGDMLMTISKFATEEKKELIELLALPYNTPAEYIMDVVKKHAPNCNINIKHNDVYDWIKLCLNGPYKYVDEGYEIFISPILTSGTYGHCSYSWKDCNPKAFHRYVWTRRDGYNTACDNCFLTAMKIVIPQKFMDTFNLDEHIIPYEEIEKKYFRK